MNLRRNLRELIIAVAIAVAVVYALAGGAFYLDNTFTHQNFTSAPE